MIDQGQKRWEMPGKWRVSEYNFVPEMAAEVDFTEPVKFIESTIRMMEVTPGTRVPFPVEDKLEIAALLDKLGVQIVGSNPTHFYGTARNKSITDGVRAIAKRGFKFKMQGGQFGVWKEPQKILEERADWYVDMGINIMTITMPSTEAARRSYAAELTYQQIVDKAIRLMEYAKTRGMESGPIFMNSSRADVDELIPIINSFLTNGADIFGLCDNGFLSPQATKYYLRRLKRGLVKRVPFLYHSHDDLGMGAATAVVAGLEGGIPDVAVNGIGETAFADTAQVAVCLELLYGVRTGLNLEMLTDLSRTVERITGVSIQPQRPITGTAAYVPSRSELQADAFIKLLRGESSRFEVFGVFAPELVGAKVPAVWRDQVLKPEVVKAKLELMGLPHFDNDVSRARDAIQARLSDRMTFPVWLEDTEVEAICRSVFGATSPAH